MTTTNNAAVFNGIEYASIEAMCQEFDMNPKIYRNRINRGWKQADALLIPVPLYRDFAVDHLGNEYATILEMCKEYDVSYHAFSSRIHRGYTLEEALTFPLSTHRASKGKECVDHLGNTFESITQMCSFYGISLSNFRRRLKYGWSLKAALTTPEKSRTIVKDHCGNTYPSTHAMCAAYGISPDVFRYRMKNGYTLEQALTTPNRQLCSAA